MTASYNKEFDKLVVPGEYGSGTDIIYNSETNTILAWGEEFTKVNEGSIKIDAQELTNQTTSLINTNWITLKTQLQKRTDLYSSVIKTVEASANFEKSTLKLVVEAMAKVTSINVDINDPKSLEAYQNAQKNLQGSFSRLIALFENYPDLKTTMAFQDFQTQIEGTENRINVAKREYNDLCKKYGRNDILFGSE
jgi:hypothetical protein